MFVDFNQNAPHKTVFGAWSVRPRVGGQVSMPLTWDDVGAVEPEDVTLATVPGLLAERGDDKSRVRTHDGEYVELQGTAEGQTFARGELDGMLALADSGIDAILAQQEQQFAGRLEGLVR